MKNLKKALIAGTCSALLVAGSVAGTMAYLTSSDEVVNTFTVGKVVITLDETNVDKDKREDGTVPERDKQNDYKIFPGQTYVKDPIVHVDTTSENSWLFVKVNNQITGIEDDTTVENQMDALGWDLVDGTTDVYAYDRIVVGGDNIPVFSNFKIKGDVTNEVLETYNNKTITVTAYAIQADGFDTAKAAWDTNASKF